MKRRENGAGSITHDKHGFRAYFSDPQGKRIGKRFKTRQQAVIWLTMARAEVFSGNYVSQSDMTVGQWSVEYLQTYCAPRVRPRTFTRYLETARYLEPISKIPLQKLTAISVQKLYNSYDISGSSKQKIHGLLTGMFRKAVALDIVRKNIMLAVDRPKCQSKEIRIFSKAEIQHLLSCIKNSKYYARYYPLVYFAIATGARLSEILALKTANIGNGYVRIDGTLQYTAGQFSTAPPKTKAGNRKVTITKETEALIRSVAGTGYVFRTSAGTPFSAQNFERAWRRIIRESGLPYRNFHALRHTHATQLLAVGVPVLEVAKRLGHSKASHTLSLYGHSIPGYDSYIPAKVRQAFFE